MPVRSPSKQRLEELIALARTYRGWSSKDLARELGRDVHHLVPNSGVPKLDIVLALADALDWTVQDVVDDLCNATEPSHGVEPDETWVELDRAAWAALQRGDHLEAASIARRGYLAASNGHERAMACVRESGAWDGVGRYLAAMEYCQRGLRERGRSLELTLTLRSNLAYFHYVLGSLDEAIGVATHTIQAVEALPTASDLAEIERSFSRFVRGSAIRATCVRGEEWADSDIDLALADLEDAAISLQRAGERQGSDLYIAAARISSGGRIALEALSGHRPVDDALERFLTLLDNHVDVGGLPRTDLEVIGWWSVFAAELALARIGDGDRLDQLLAIFTNKVDEVADVSGNWAFRERLWYFELQRHRLDVETDPARRSRWVIDADDAREISGVMARFPRFRAAGWQVFRAAEIGDRT